MKTLSDKRHLAKGIRNALIALGAILAVLVAVLFLEYLTLRRTQFSTWHAASFSALSGRRNPLPPSSAALIRTWMTFDYVNRIFNLQPEYLKTQFMITDARYPRISLSSYARIEGADPNVFLQSVVAAVEKYPPQ